jgi:hypothetical protein
MTKITRLTVGKGRTRETDNGKAWVREYYELEVTVDDATDVEVGRANALGLIDGWLSPHSTTPKAIMEATPTKQPTLEEIQSLRSEERVSEKGKYQLITKIINKDNPEFEKLQSYLKKNRGFAILHGMKFWLFDNPDKIGYRR